MISALGKVYYPMEASVMEAKACELIEKANKAEIPLCLLGGVGVRIACREALALEPSLARSIQDIDFASYKQHRAALEKVMLSERLRPNREMNILNASTRQMYFWHSDDEEIPIDIIFDNLEMCYKIPLKSRLEIGKFTLDLTDLLLTKLQIVELNEKDILDIMAILLESNLEKSEGCNREGEMLNLSLLRKLCGKNWGFYYTAATNLRRVEMWLSNDSDLNDNHQDVIKESIGNLVDYIEKIPKSLMWYLRSIIGTRMRYYNVPEEPLL